MQKTVGVIGGMGPEATVDFMARVLMFTEGQDDQDHARMLVDNNPKVPSRQLALLGDGEDPGPTMAAMARGLEAAGADFLVMPCNTAHAFADAIAVAVSIPLVSIIELTVAACAGHATLGLLATRGCLEARVYQDAFVAAGRELVLPDDGELAKFTELIRVIKAGDRSSGVAARMQSLAEAQVARGATAIVAGCTEITLVLAPDMLNVPLVSSTDELARMTAAICAGRSELPRRQAGIQP